MSKENLQNVDVALSSLPYGADNWLTKRASEKTAYEQWCEGERRRLDPFGDNLYEKPKIPFGPYFVDLAETNNGYGRRGAYFLYKALSNVPEGYTYYGKVPAGEVIKYEHLGVLIIETEARDLDGELLEDYVAVAVRKDLLEKTRKASKKL